MGLPLLPESTPSPLLGTRRLQQPFPGTSSRSGHTATHAAPDVPQSAGAMPPASHMGMPKAALPKLLLLELPTSLGTNTSRKLWGPD